MLKFNCKTCLKLSKIQSIYYDEMNYRRQKQIITFVFEDASSKTAQGIVF